MKVYIKKESNQKIFDKEIWPMMQDGIKELHSYEKEKEWFVDTFKNGEVLVFRDNQEKLISYISLDYPEKNIAWIASFQVLKKFQSKGIGTKMIKLVEEFVKNKKCSEINFTVSKKNGMAIRFYDKLGFVFVNDFKNDVYYKMRRKI